MAAQKYLTAKCMSQQKIADRKKDYQLKSPASQNWVPVNNEGQPKKASKIWKYNEKSIFELFLILIETIQKKIEL